MKSQSKGEDGLLSLYSSCSDVDAAVMLDTFVFSAHTLLGLVLMPASALRDRVWNGLSSLARDCKPYSDPQSHFALCMALGILDGQNEDAGAAGGGGQAAQSTTAGMRGRNGWVDMCGRFEVRVGLDAGRKAVYTQLLGSLATLQPSVRVFGQGTFVGVNAHGVAGYVSKVLSSRRHVSLLKEARDMYNAAHGTRCKVHIAHTLGRGMTASKFREELGDEDDDGDDKKVPARSEAVLRGLTTTPEVAERLRTHPQAKVRTALAKAISDSVFVSPSFE